MRFYEFKPKTLLEYDASMSDKDLRNEIVGLLKTEEDREMLDKIYTALNQSGLDDRIGKVLSADDDTKGKLDIFAGLILHTKGTFNEKQSFLENFPKGFVNTKQLMAKNNIQSFDGWLDPDPFVQRVFRELYKYSEMGIGKGEYALAVMSPQIKFAGRSAADHGDITINGTSVEVKAQVKEAGGRFMDARKAKINQTGIIAAFKAAGLDVNEISSKSGISDTQWVKTVRPMIESKPAINKIAEAIIKGLFTHVSSADGKPLKNAIATGDLSQIRLEWGILSYTNYQKMSNFTSMLMLSLLDNSSLFFTSAKDISSKIKTKGAFLLGAEQTIHPQVVIDMKGAGSDFSDMDTGGIEIPTTTKRAPRKSKEQNKADARKDDLAQKRAEFGSSKLDRASDNWFDDRFK